jgi:hypothetical protein
VRNNKAIFFPIYNAFAAEPEHLKFNGKDLCDETSVNFDIARQALYASVDGIAIGDSLDLTTNYQQGCRKNLAEQPLNPDFNLFKINQPPVLASSYFQNLASSWVSNGYYPATDLPGPWDTITDGYWVMLEPLSTGEHTIRFGMTPSPEAPNQYSQDNTWIVNSVEAPAPLPLLGATAAFGWSRRLRRRLSTTSKAQSSD